uniref:Uncharacterized protein n=1 Tax=Wuchereria bancrofti TaxID=6293 RepID=A0AAF5PRL8_WUCBA
MSRERKVKTTQSNRDLNPNHAVVVELHYFDFQFRTC